MPAHREHLTGPVRWPQKIGPHCATAAQQIIEGRDHPGVPRLPGDHPPEPPLRDAAVRHRRRALALDVSYRSIH
jgi:hypothetical protein